MFWREREMNLEISGCVIVSLNPHTHAGVGV